MTIKESIIAAIKAKYPAINLSKARLNAIAAKIEAEVIDDDTKIDAALDTFNKYNPLAEIAKTDDKIRTLEAKEKNPGQQTPPKDNPPADPIPDDVPAWAKSLIESNKTLAEKLGAFESQNQQTSMHKKLGDQLKDVPASYWSKRSLPTKDEEIEAFITDVKNDYSTFTKDLTDKGIAVIPQPGGGIGGVKPGEVSPEIKAFAAKQNPAPAKQS